jgi:DNA polymerase III epsilon subunit-like protein
MKSGASGTETLYFSVDVEASGPVPGLYNLVSIGAVPVASEGGAHRPGTERFYVELKPIGGAFEKEAMAVHGISRKHLEEQGTEASKGMRDLREFVETLCRPRKARAVFVGHNAAFDWSYISYYFTLFKIPNPFGYKALDIKSMAMGRAPRGLRRAVPGPHPVRAPGPGLIRGGGRIRRWMHCRTSGSSSSGSSSSC